MKWYYTTGPVHTHVRVLMSGALCGTLTFRNEEFAGLCSPTRPLARIIEFIEEMRPLEDALRQGTAPRSINNPEFIRHCSPEGAPDV